jgi:signal transduction histidine kinase
MAPLAQNAEIELRTHIADDVPDTFYGDRLRLYQILVNLASNAIRFTEKGQVDVRIYLPDANHWALQVQDTGCGISKEAQAQIFDPFQKALVGEASDTVERGAGLGLAIVKQLTEFMNGDIRVESEIGSGSTFTIVLPLLSEADVNLDDQPAEAERLDMV